MSDEEDFVFPRPWSDEGAATGKRPGQQLRRKDSKTFKPELPSADRPVEKVTFSSGSNEGRVELMLQEAYRQQTLEHGDRVRTPGRQSKSVQFGVQRQALARAAAQAPLSAGSTAAPRKMKEKKEGRCDIMDLASIADGKNYYPISLPYYFDEDEVTEAHEGQSKSSRPTSKHIDEQNANAAKELFFNASDALQEDQYFLMQLPAVLPECTDPVDDGAAGDAADAACISRYPDGKIGKLRIHKSGKVIMDIGGLPFCVDQGCTTFFRQDIACVNPHAQEFIDLGPITKRMVLTPDFDTILTQLPPRPSSIPAEPAEAK